MSNPTIQVTVVWLPDDWEQPPVHGGEAAFSLTGSGEPALYQASFTVKSDMPVAVFLEEHLQDSARIELANRSRGVSIWGRRVKSDQRLCAKDRVELLGTISADPKSNRRARVKQERAAQMTRRWRR